MVAVYTADDLVADGVGHLPAISEIKDADGHRHREPQHLPMPPGKVRHVGDIAAMIVAATLDQAQDAAEPAGDRPPAAAGGGHRGAGPGRGRAAGARRCAGQPDAAGARAMPPRPTPPSLPPRTSRRSRSARRGRSCTIRDPRRLVGLRAGRRPGHRDLVVAGRADPVPVPMQRSACSTCLAERLRLVTEDVGGGFGPGSIRSRLDRPDRVGDAQPKRPAGPVSAASLAVADSHARDLVASGALPRQAAADGAGAALASR
ncbi:MAG: hypothetical protein U1E23_03340 [Reyranellaceae bacterium]